MKPFHAILLILAALTIWSCQEESEEISTPIKISGVVTHVSEFGGNDGAIILSISGGSQPYTFRWSNSKTTRDIDGLTAGTYYIEVIDSKNKNKTDTFEVTQPSPLSMSIEFEITDPSQTGSKDGKIITRVLGGYGPYVYSWSNGASTRDIEGIGAGTFSLEVTDSKNQTASASATLVDCLRDVDGNLYRIVRIGEQVWMKDNLRVRHAPDNSLVTAYPYNNDTSYVKTYGLLYTWDAAMNGSKEEGACGICPAGWHIPSDEEFKILEMHLGMSRAQADMVNVWRGTHIGTSLKMGGESGYDARLAGRRSTEGAYSLMGRAEYVWTSTEYGTNAAWRRCLDLYANDVGRWNTFPKSYGFSVRCVKDK